VYARVSLFEEQGLDNRDLATTWLRFVKALWENHHGFQTLLMATAPHAVGGNE
jgi:hypothetical protein